MKIPCLLKVPFTVFLLFLVVNSVWCQESEQKEKQQKTRKSKLMWRLSEQDVILPITSIEWGIPDRWSFTSRFVHELGKDRDGKEWFHSLCVTVSPGISGGRFAVSYHNIYDPKSSTDFGILSEARIVLLRTWGNPLSTLPNLTFVGAEFRTGFSWLINFGIGYYSQISDSNGSREQFYGLHVGVGI